MRTGTVSYRLEDLKNRVIIPIGFVGENDFTRVIFDAEEIYKKYPSASVSMKVQPPKGVIYPAAVTRDGNTVIWQVKEADVANRGGGELQLTFTDGETKIKTYIARTDVKRSLAGNGPAPDPVKEWVDNAEKVLDDMAAMDNIAKNAKAGDIGKALSPKTIENGVVTEWQFVEPGAGTEDYADLDNKPSIAGVTLSGNKTLEDLGIASDDDLDNLAAEVSDVKSEIQGISNLSKCTLELEIGGIDSSTGNRSITEDRLRTFDFIPSAVDKLTTNATGGILLYAWEGETYKGFWGGSGWVTSGSQYIETVDMQWFREHYPTYKFKAIVATSNGAYKNVYAVVKDESSFIDDIRDETSKISASSILPIEVGTFDSQTGEKTIHNTERIRTKDFISENVSRLKTVNTTTNEKKILLYAWEGDTYKGFWGGSGWVKSGSQYLEEPNIEWFRNNYPTYKFKAVCIPKVSGDTVIVAYYDDSIENRLSNLENNNKSTSKINLNANVEYENGGLSVDYNGTVSGTTSSTRIRTKTSIPADVKTIMCSSGYVFLLYPLYQDGKSPGSYKESGAFEISGTSALLTHFDVSQYNFAGYRIVLRKVDGTEEITPEEATANVQFYAFRTADQNAGNADDIPDIFADNDNNLCLCGIKTDIQDDKLPFHRGYLFHSFETAQGNKLWYGNSLKSAKEIGVFPVDPRTLRFAISPKDGRIIATKRDTRSGIWVWDGSSYVKLESFTTKPMAWLYNSGVDFINDGDDEYCIFAEYEGSGTLSTGYVFNVWRGKYPYTSASDWEVVLTQEYGNDINHFHMVKRDPWSDVLYLTSGDDSAKCKWWYSTDAGATWTLLTSGSTSGYEDHICRTINFIFTEDYIYWATDKGTNHCLNKAERDGNGILDPSTRVKMCDLPSGYATNSLCYVESPKGLFMYDRVDIGYDSQYGDPVALKFYDLSDSTLKDVVTIPLAENTWGGCRGKCYINYTNSLQPFPAMGFSPDSPCIFDIITDDLDKIGTIAFDPASKRFYTVIKE